MYDILWWLPVGLIGFIGILIIYLWIFWGFYVLVMGLYRAYLDKRLTLFLKFMAFPFLVIGASLDVFANIFIATILFLELPKEWLVTSRLIRIMKEEDSWRKRIAEFVCEGLLDLFDPTGEHC